LRALLLRQEDFDFGVFRLYNQLACQSAGLPVLTFIFDLADKLQIVLYLILSQKLQAILPPKMRVKTGS
jgi:hypothetical protein